MYTEEYAEFIKFYQNRNSEKRQKIVYWFYNKYLPLIKSLAKQYTRYDTYEDIVQESYFLVDHVLCWLEENYDNIKSENFKIGRFIKYKINSFYSFKLRQQKKRSFDSFSINDYLIAYNKTSYDCFIEKEIKEDIKKLLDLKEQKVIDLVFQNTAKSKIAELLGVAEVTVYKYIENIERKLFQSDIMKNYFYEKFYYKNTIECIYIGDEL